MSDASKKNQPTKTVISTVTPRILITHKKLKKFKKWKGCIYFSSSDLTGQVLQFMDEFKSDFTGTFLKNPIFIYCSSNKSEIERKMKKQISKLI